MCWSASEQDQKCSLPKSWPPNSPFPLLLLEYRGSRVGRCHTHQFALAVATLLVMIQRAGPVGACAATPWRSVPALITKKGTQKYQRDSCAGRVFVIPLHIGVTEHRIQGLPLFLAVLDAFSWAGTLGLTDTFSHG